MSDFLRKLFGLQQPMPPAPAPESWTAAQSAFRTLIDQAAAWRAAQPASRQPDRRPQNNAPYPSPQYRVLYEESIDAAVIASSDAQRLDLLRCCDLTVSIDALVSLSESERLELLPYDSFPHPSTHLLRSLVFEALCKHFSDTCPEAAAAYFTALSGRERHQGRAISGFHRVCRTMERGDPEAYANHAPLRRAWEVFRANQPHGLHDNALVAAELEARASSLIGIDPPRGFRNPVSGTTGLVSIEDFQLIRAYVEATESFASEAKQWCDKARAVDNACFRDAALRWTIANSVQVPLYPDGCLDDFPLFRAVPLRAAASIRPSPPAWMLEAAAIYRRAETSERGWAEPCLAHAAWYPHSSWIHVWVDRPWLLESRALAEKLLPNPPFDWADKEVVKHEALRRCADGTLIALLSKARSSTPSKTWLNAASALLGSAECASVVATCAEWIKTFNTSLLPISEAVAFRCVQYYRDYERRALKEIALFGGSTDAAIVNAVMIRNPFSRPARYGHVDPNLLSTENDTILRGIIWLKSLDASSVEFILEVALASLVRIVHPEGGFQYRSLIGVNACIWALGRIATPEAVTALGRIRRRVRDERISKLLAKAMAEAAIQAGLTIEALEEIATPSHGLDAAGTITQNLAGGITATLAITSSTEAAVTLTGPTGKPLKSTPVAVKSDADSAATLKSLKATATEIAQTLPSHRLRLERSWITGTSWTGREFRERYLEHPLLNWLAARLVWRLAPADGGPARTLFLRDGQTPIAADDRSLPAIEEGDTLTFWHPLTPAEPDAVTDWRDFLIRHGITQPIKQAHRETYPLTPAEAATGTYSNRFAGHIIRQAQSNALARLRGWSARSRIWADVRNDEPTHIKIPAHGLAAEFWTEGAGGDDPEVTDAQAYLFLKTDRIRFRRLADAGDWRRDGGRHLTLQDETIPVADIPPVVFSEVMRDADLFVGVASIGHDPNWLDAGAHAHHPDQWRRQAGDRYWQDFNTGALSESARSRREFLQMLVPKLAIAACCAFDDRHLFVQGKRARYAIHLGSGNVFIEPEHRYLCIVPDMKSGAPNILLPFEGDRLLSAILSKVFLLANDTAIKDAGILAQIGR
ncbi:DUF4132 domain-containing protein [Plastoroseomonas arctica]|uniref:DUF4132 domain-containing protein n=1 Tax=Plastoroseomonas arctica TaxID=1509237 RepID=A0AAF1K673_9PROT|nr:DUF4132 domain-containing protein [Plastoroseomonas arctica]MBR0656949.1 DUF4132 domain-containing protein [Plastoroseomonas arctica]